jgi:hypothetical protein
VETVWENEHAARSVALQHCNPHTQRAAISSSLSNQKVEGADWSEHRISATLKALQLIFR